MKLPNDQDRVGIQREGIRRDKRCDRRRSGVHPSFAFGTFCELACDAQAKVLGTSAEACKATCRR